MMSKRITDNDKTLFRLSMRDVTPLKLKKKRISKAVRHQHNTTKTIDSIPSSPIPTLFLDSQFSEPKQPESILAHGSHGLSRKQFMSLKNGQHKIQATLDLHGFLVDQAQIALSKFIMESMAKNHRYLLIIHGKGRNHGQLSVLKSFVNHWLKQTPDVLAFHSAQPYQGGTGAVYVLLKRQRHMLE